MYDVEAPAFEVLLFCQADSAHSVVLEALFFDLPPAPLAPLPWFRPCAVHGAGEPDLSRSRLSPLLRDLRLPWLLSSDSWPLPRGLGDIDLLALLGDLLARFLGLDGDLLASCEYDSEVYDE